MLSHSVCAYKIGARETQLSSSLLVAIFLPSLFIQIKTRATTNVENMLFSTTPWLGHVFCVGMFGNIKSRGSIK